MPSERESLAGRLEEIAPPGQAGDRKRIVAYALNFGSEAMTDDEALAEARALLGENAPSDNGAKLDRDEPTPERSSWEPVDLTAILEGEADPEPPPKMLARSDGELLLYAGKIHLFAGEPEGGKGWLAMKAAGERLEAGEHVIYVDFEDEAAAAVDRLGALGASADVIAERFHYVRPDEPLDDRGRAAIEHVLETFQPTLAVIDGLTDGLAVHGIDLRDNTEVANWMRDLPQSLRRRGITTVLNDHVVKDGDARGRYSIGAQHKLAKVDVAYHLNVKEPLGRGLTGRVLIRVEKDRPGHVRRLARHKLVAEMIGESLPGGAMDLALEPPSEAAGDTFRPTGYMEKVSRAVAHEPGLSITALRSAVGGKAEYVDRARECLINEGYLDPRRDGQAVRHYEIRPFVEEEEGHDEA